ncbi:MAG: exodeoxyribonuclease VII large subunit [Deltaproteobacteria bacterium]|nr:MAG: exodeoxyribonuclease VII large subunit [Deltaproteobacteria bacterium]
MRGEREDYLTVSELTSRVKFLLEEEFPHIRVGGEVTDYRVSDAGHHYFSLKDERSQVRVVLFRGKSRFVKGDLKNGNFAVVEGSLTVYEPRGEYQILADAVFVSGVGNLLLKYHILREKLEKEGLFDESRKKKIPLFCSRVGVVTSLSGAAVRDIVRIIRNRFPNTEIIISPTSVQGEGAAREISEALRLMDEYGEVDVIIVGRGGGSLEDLWAFNEEEVVRTVASLKTPVISAVGHERDFTLTDFAADVRASTPSNAAEIAVMVKRDVVERIGHLLTRVVSRLSERIETLKGRVGTLRGELKDPRLIVRGMMLRLADLEDRLTRSSPERRIRELKKLISDFLFIMEKRLADLFSERKRGFESLKGKLHALDPKGILKRGYSITLDQETGKVLTSSSETAPGRKVKTILGEGGFLSTVEEVQK